MRRLTVIALLAAGLPVLFAAASSAGDSRTYRIELDNAFGLVTGSDVKVAGVRAGSIKDLDINAKKRAVATVEFKPGVDPLRTDARCDTRPQSLIAEFFIDCQPGRARELPPMGEVPVSHTSSTVQPDLVNNILREPYRDRLRLIINEFGTGLAGRPEDLNRAVHSGAPALRETEKVLEVLGRQNKVIADLNRDSDEIIGALASNRKDVSRFVTEARQTAQASAERRSDISAGLHRLPTFLAELQPTMKRLGEVADEQTPLLTDLRSAAPELERFTRTVGPFSDASLPSLKTLGAAAQIGRRALSHGRDEIATLRKVGENVQPVSDDLGKLVSDLDNRDFALEPDPRSPGGKGYTVLEGILNYGYYQAGSLNTFDKFGHSLRVALIPETPCAAFATIAYEKKADGTRDPCVAWLGPNQPGLTEQVCIKKSAKGKIIQNFCPVPPYDADFLKADERTRARRLAENLKLALPGGPQAAPQLPGAPPGPGQEPQKVVPELPGPLNQILHLPGGGQGNQGGQGSPLPKLPGLPKVGPRSSRNHHAGRRRATNDLLDYLFGS